MNAHQRKVHVRSTVRRLLNGEITPEHPWYNANVAFYIKTRPPAKQMEYVVALLEVGRKRGGQDLPGVIRNLNAVEQWALKCMVYTEKPMDAMWDYDRLPDEVTLFLLGGATSTQQQKS